MQTITPPNCSKCQGQMKQKQNDKGIYFACPNWKPENKGCEGEFWTPPENTSIGRNGVPRVVSPQPAQKTPPEASESHTNASTASFEVLQNILSVLEDIKQELVASNTFFRKEQNDKPSVDSKAKEPWDDLQLPRTEDEMPPPEDYKQ